MAIKIKPVVLNLLREYLKISNNTIYNKSIMKIVSGFDTGFSMTYMLNVTNDLIKEGYLIRDVNPMNNSVTHIVTKKGIDVLKYNNIISEDIVEEVEEVEEITAPTFTGDEISDDVNIEVKDEVEVIGEVVEKSEPQQLAFSDEEKKQAILSMVNETLTKTVMYCQDLSSTLMTLDRVEELKALEAGKDELQKQLNTKTMIVNHLEEQKAKVKESVPNIMAMLKCSLESRMAEHHDLIPWQRELMREKLMKDLLSYVDEALEDIKSLLVPKED